MVLTIIILIIAVLVLSINAFWIQIIVNGSSMEPTFYDGEVGYCDTLLPNVFGYDRFDIVVVDDPTKDTEYLLVKRIIGLPNETIQYKEGKLYVDGVYVEEDFLNESDALCTCYNYIGSNDKNICLPDGITLKENEYFIMGDNRSVSKDSRSIGPVQKDDLKGKVIIMKTEEGTKFY